MGGPRKVGRCRAPSGRMVVDGWRQPPGTQYSAFPQGRTGRVAWSGGATPGATGHRGGGDLWLPAPRGVVGRQGCDRLRHREEPQEEDHPPSR